MIIHQNTNIILQHCNTVAPGVAKLLLSLNVLVEVQARLHLLLIHLGNFFLQLSGASSFWFWRKKRVALDWRRYSCEKHKNNNKCSESLYICTLGLRLSWQMAWGELHKAFDCRASDLTRCTIHFITHLIPTSALQLEGMD